LPPPILVGKAKFSLHRPPTPPHRQFHLTGVRVWGYACSNQTSVASTKTPSMVAVHQPTRASGVQEGLTNGGHRVNGTDRFLPGGLQVLAAVIVVFVDDPLLVPESQLVVLFP